ncbi:MAG: VOC family protein [Candidatus Brocadiia bacterium]|jgi:catechol 2,3-dioxygenase-like lactoylglutathione lyase family enzyme
MHFDMDHIALNVRDMNSMLRFYVAVLGLKPERLDLYRKRKAPFPSVRVNADTIIDLFPAAMWQGKQGKRVRKLNPDARLNHVCLAIRKGEWASFLKRIRKCGVHVLEGPVPRWGAHGTGISVYFYDPDGNKIEVRHYPAKKRGRIEGLVS